MASPEGIMALAAFLDGAEDLSSRSGSSSSLLQPQDLALYLQSLREDLLKPLQYKASLLQGA
jgi:hypothetical protein